MRVLVTGGAGYVGSISVEVLLAAGHAVVVLDDLATGHRGSVPAEVPLVEGTYEDAGLLTRTLGDLEIDAVLHCGGRSLVSESMRDPAAYFATNVAGGIVLLDSMRATGVNRIVFSSSAAVYGRPDATPIPEDAPLRPINPYGETKRSFEAALTWYGAAYGLRSASLRYFNVAGATKRNGEVHQPETHLIPNVLGSADGGPPITLFGDDYETSDGFAVRDYVDATDLGKAHLAALEATAPDDARTEASLVCNLGSGVGFSVREVMAAAERVVGAPIPHQVGPRREGDPAVLVASIDRAADVLGWRPQRSDLESMIGSAWAWRRAHPEGYSA